MLEDSTVMLGSMYGDPGYRMPVDVETGTADPSRIDRTFLGGGMMVGPGGKPENTTISALITLTTVRPDHDPNSIVPRVIVWHSACARIPFPADSRAAAPRDAPRPRLSTAQASLSRQNPPSDAHRHMYSVQRRALQPASLRHGNNQANRGERRCQTRSIVHQHRRSQSPAR